jgi:DNA-directed RNA polymerase subunit RPC12/RpoP
MIEFSCIYCGQLIRTEEEPAGRHMECPGCGHSVTVRRRQPGAALRPPHNADEQDQKEASSWEQKNDREIIETLLPKAMTRQQRQDQALKEAFSSLAPRYDDLTLFALGLSFALLWWINPGLRHELTMFFIAGWPGGISFWLLVAVIGMALSLLNVFLAREKSELARFSMLVFAVVVTAGTGLYAGWLMLQHSKGWLLVFPAWNLLNGGILLILFYLHIIGTECITDEQAGFADVVLTAVCVPVVLTVCQYYFELHWATTFSIAVAYTMSLRRAPAGTGRRPGPLISYSITGVDIDL